MTASALRTTLFDGSHVLSYIMLIALLGEEDERKPKLGSVSNLPKGTEPLEVRVRI